MQALAAQQAPVAEGVPIIDLALLEAGSEAADALARQVDEALVRIGFFIIVNHGVPRELVQAADRSARAFFDLSMPQKTAIASTAKGSPRGYVPIGQSVLGRTMGEAPPVDLKEGFGMGPQELPNDVDPSAQGFYSHNVWPAQMPALRRDLLTYYAEMEELSRRMFTLFARALKLPLDFFERCLQSHNCTLRVNHYPAQDTAPLPGQLRGGPHTDFGVFTILLSQNASGGLQVRTRAGQWLDIVAPPDAFVVNIGDMMMRWTNDHWLSNLHRVVNPDAQHARTERRQSIAFFANPREDMSIECIPTCMSEDNPPRHPPVQAGAYRLKKIRAAAGD